MKKLGILISLMLMLFLGACHPVQKILKSKDVNYKLTKANEYYAKEKWVKANEIYQSLMPVLRGTKNYEELCYRYCYTFYNMENYLSASYQFKNFVEAFPNSKRVDECEFMYAKCLYLQSPRYTLDQTATEKAITALQSFIDTHPNSSKIIKANQYIDICQEKMQKKASERAKLYFDMEDYKAATVAYQNVIQQFPASEKGDYYLYMRQKSFFYYAKESILKKQSQRYEKSLKIFEQLKEYYPHSKLIGKALMLRGNAKKQISKLKQKKQ